MNIHSRILYNLILRKAIFMFASCTRWIKQQLKHRVKRSKVSCYLGCKLKLVIKPKKSELRGINLDNLTAYLLAIQNFMAINL